MDNYAILQNVNNSFYKLFTGCLGGGEYSPPIYNTSEGINALIILNQLVYLLVKTRDSQHMLDLMLVSSIDLMIRQQCKEYTGFYIDGNADTFVTSFYEYVNNVILNFTDNTDMLMS